MLAEGSSLKREAIADRLVNYCDAVAAFSIVNSLAFLLAMTETEVRCSHADRALLVYTGLVAFAVVLTILVVWCHRWRAAFERLDNLSRKTSSLCAEGSSSRESPLSGCLTLDRFLW